MTRHKTFKRRVRARMEKTSESYSAARRQLIAKAAGTPPTHSEAETQDAVQPAKAPVDTGVEAQRVSGEAVAAKTGRSWNEWFLLLDEWGSSSRNHPEIAGWLSSEHGVSGWWAQSITVAYEQARGLRVPGQSRDGSFSVSASKTIGVPVDILFAAVADPEIRRKWLTDDPLEVTTSSPLKSVRGRWDDGDSRVAFGFTAKGESKSQIGLGHERISDADTAQHVKQYWTERLKDLKKLLEH